jgi:hypothetical protein
MHITHTHTHTHTHTQAQAQAHKHTQSHIKEVVSNTYDSTIAQNTINPILSRNICFQILYLLNTHTINEVWCGTCLFY